MAVAGMGASHGQSDSGEAAIEAGRARTEARRLFSAATLVAVGLFLVRPAAAQTVINVTDGASMSAAIAQVDSNASASYVINLQNNITLTGAASNTLNAFNTTSNVIVNGNGFTLDGGSVQRGFLVYSGTVAIENITIQNTQALGGSGSSALLGGGGGAGLGGALFVASSGAVTMSNVTLLSNNATGGNGGSGALGLSAGGGMGGNGSASGGGGVGLGANGGSSGSPNGSAGIIVGAGAGGNGTFIGSGSGGANGGGGGFLGGGGGVSGGNAVPGSSGVQFGGNGGFGGGGGVGNTGGSGGFGGGGGAGQTVGGNGGFGGGSGAGDATFIGGHDGSGGFGGGNGGAGGGAGLGGAIFVQQGGSLTLAGTLTVNGNTVTAGSGGSGGSNGSAFGAGMFLQGSGTLMVQPGSGQTQTISDVIADEVGVVAKGYTPPAGTFTGSESWSLVKSGSGTLVLSGANSYSGGTVISAGTLQLSGAGTLGLTTATTTINSGGTLNLGGTTQTQAGVNLSGGTLQNGLLNAAVSSTGGTIDNIGGSASLTTTAGLTTVAGTNSYTGLTTVNGGVLNVTGTISDPTVNAGGMLTGTGTVGVTQINAGGIFMPGSGAPGTAMTIAGNLAFASGALYVVSLNPSTSSFVNVTGAATLGGTVNAIFAPGSYLTKQYLILQSAGISGRFSGLANSNLPAGFTDSLGYSNNAVVLDVVATLGVLSAQQGLSPNQQTVANTLAGFFNNGGALPPNFFGVFGLTGNNLSNALSQLNGEAATGAETSAFQLMNEFLDMMLDPFASGRGFASNGGGGAIGFAVDQQASLPPEIALAYAGVLKAPPMSFDQRWSVWGGAFGGSNTAQGNAAAGSNTVGAKTYGFTAGVDYRLSSSTVVGFALAGSGTGWGLANSLGNGTSQAVQVGGYGISRFGSAYLSAALAFTNNWFTLNRSALGDQLTANFSGQSYGARLEGGYRFTLPLPSLAGATAPGSRLGVTPYAALQAQDFSTPNYSETDKTGGGFGLSYAAMNATDVRTELGARFDDPTLLAGKPLILSGRIAWAHDFVGNPALSASFEGLPGSSFTVFGAPIPHDLTIASAGAQYFLSPNWSVAAKFYGSFGAGYQTYAGNATLRYVW
jgi:uncharacterized protein with beta-barrel porin domain